MLRLVITVLLVVSGTSKLFYCMMSIVNVEVLCCVLLRAGPGDDDDQMTLHFMYVC